MKRKIEVVEDDLIRIDGFEIGGWFVGDYCQNCRHELILYEDYDSEFCPECNEWTVSCCGEGDCMFCKDRPDKPFSK